MTLYRDIVCGFTRDLLKYIVFCMVSQGTMVKYSVWFHEGLQWKLWFCKRPLWNIFCGFTMDPGEILSVVSRVQWTSCVTLVCIVLYITVLYMYMYITVQTAHVRVITCEITNPRLNLLPIHLDMIESLCGYPPKKALSLCGWCWLPMETHGRNVTEHCKT